MSSSPPRLPSFGAILLAAVAGLAAPTRADGPFAGVVTEANAAGWLVGGPDAVGGIGDWAFGNGTLCALVSEPSRPTDISTSGGFLLDLGHCGAEDDQLGNLVPLVNVDRKNVPRVEHVEARFDSREARVVTRARWKGIEIHTAYVLDTAEPETLRMETRVERVAADGRFAVMGLLSVHPNATLRAFTFDTELPSLATGFTHPPTPTESLRSALGGLARSDVQVLVGPDDDGPGIAYGVQLASAWRAKPDGEQDRLPHVALNGQPFSLLGVFVRPFWLGGGERLGVLALAQAPFMNLSQGTSLHLVYRVHVGARSDVASVTDRLWADGPELSGRVDDSAARLHVSRDGQPVTQVRPDPDGRFAFRVPEPGDYELLAVAPGARRVRLPVSVAGAGFALGHVALGGAGRVLLPRGHAMRLVFQGRDGTPDPYFGDDLLGLRFGSKTPANSALASYVSLAGTPDDPASVTLAPGRYRVYATHGLEWSVEETGIEVRAGQKTPLAIGIPRREVATPGWILADLHVHAGGSFDSTLSYAERIRSFAAQGGEVLVSTEHDHVVDYRPLVREMGLAEAIHVIPGLEVTGISRTEAVPYTAGHANVLPFEPLPFAHRGGALQSQGVRLRGPIAELRARGGRPRLLQVNHARVEEDVRDDEALFTHLSVVGRPFEPTRPLDAEPNRALLEPDPETGVRDLDFDAIELLNGKTGPLLSYYRRTRADWLSLLRQGERRTATANSDSHKNLQLVAIPTNYVQVADDRPARLDEDAFIAAIGRGALVGTSGPFVEATLAQVGPGGTLASQRGELVVRVEAAGWVPVSELRVYVNGALHTRQAIARGETARIGLDFRADAFVTVEVEGGLEGEAGARYRAVAPDFVPFAFTNPIFVDFDADGVWTPPGLEAPLPPTLTDPLGS